MQQFIISQINSFTEAVKQDFARITNGKKTKESGKVILYGDTQKLVEQYNLSELSKRTKLVESLNSKVQDLTIIFKNESHFNILNTLCSEVNILKGKASSLKCIIEINDIEHFIDNNSIESISSLNIENTELVFKFSNLTLNNIRNQPISNKFKIIVTHLENTCSKVGITFTINRNNLHFIDDYVLWSEDLKINKWAIALSSKLWHSLSSNNITPEERFHLALFLTNIKRRKNFSSEQKQYYNWLGEIVYFAPSTLNKWLQISDKRILIIDKVIGNINLSITPNISKATISGYQLLELFPFKHFRHEEISGKGLSNFIAENRKIFSNKKSDYTLKKRIISAKYNSIPTPPNTHPSTWKSVIITGWYGTETTGDKAIIGELLHFIKYNSPNCKIYLTTILQLISEQTNLELGDLKGVTLIPIEKAHSPEIIEKVDAVIMGGGPLMDTTKLINVWNMFSEASKQQKARIIFGCGVGPIHASIYKEAITGIIAFATAGFFRDKESYEYASKLYPGHNLEYACDPAVGFIKRWKHKIDKFPKIDNEKDKALNIATLLRANTNEFYVKGNKQALKEFNKENAKKIANIIRPICKKNKCLVQLLHMNAPWIGGDDRLFNRYVEDCFSSNEDIYNERSYLTTDGLIQALNNCDVSIAMRYHGHIFSMALGVPFISIDYTGKKGKVFSLVNRVNYGDWSEKWEEIDPLRASNHFEQLIDEREYWSQYLIEQSNHLVSELYNTYEKVFDCKVPMDF